MNILVDQKLDQKKSANTAMKFIKLFEKALVRKKRLIVHAYEVQGSQWILKFIKTNY